MHQPRQALNKISADINSEAHTTLRRTNHAQTCANHRQSTESHSHHHANHAHTCANHKKATRYSPLTHHSLTNHHSPTHTLHTHPPLTRHHSLTHSPTTTPQSLTRHSHHQPLTHHPHTNHTNHSLTTHTPTTPTTPTTLRRRRRNTQMHKSSINHYLNSFVQINFNNNSISIIFF